MASNSQVPALRQFAKNVMWTLENHLAHPVRRQHARFTVMCWRLLTLIRSLRTPFAVAGSLVSQSVWTRRLGGNVGGMARPYPFTG